MRGASERDSRRTWLLAIGQGLRVEYAANEEPVPECLAALLNQVEMPQDHAVIASEVPRPKPRQRSASAGLASGLPSRASSRA
jgi:hypothetical protein